MSRTDILIVGSGHGGVQAASELRKIGFDGTVTLVTADNDTPYERPPLSKEYLQGEKDEEAIHARSPEFWADKAIDLRLGEEVVTIDADGHRVRCASGLEFDYTKLIWAAGGEPRRLTCDGHDLAGVHSIRTLADVDQLRAELGVTERVVVIGGGYIGLEAAASLTKLGKQVVVLEAVDRLLARVAASVLSDFYRDLHQSRGVDIRLGAIVTCIEGDSGRARRVRLADGSALDCDMVIVGIGIVPLVGPLGAAGADCPNGAAVDVFCQTSLPDVYAIGDCALHRNAFGPDQPVRVESVQNAVDQATTVAHHIVGQGTPYAATPWFWSNQYDVKLQTVGLNSGYDDIIVRGDPASGRFSVVYLRDGKIAAFDCVNLVKDYVQGRKLIEASYAVTDRDMLADQETPLKSLVQQD